MGWPQRILTRQFTAVDGRPQEGERMKFKLVIDLDGVKMPKAAIAHALHGVAERLAIFNEGMAGEMDAQIPGPDGKAFGSWEIVEEPKAGKTLADFAEQHSQNPDKVLKIKRPETHANAYIFTAYAGCVKESDGRLPRLTAEDLTATDWQEVTE